MEFRIPKDSDNNNWLRDNGWYPWAGGEADFVADTFPAGPCQSAADCDRDHIPDGAGQPTVAGRYGDGFTHFEEFRGFIVRGEHRRTAPRHKDLFVSSDVFVQGTYVGIQYAFPKDNNNNWLPDNGWYPWAGGGADFVADTFAAGPCPSAADCDNDHIPDGTGQPTVAGRYGDGFTHFEEFRGFIVRGEHRRTDPRHKDVFVSSDVWVQNTYVGIQYAFPRLTTATHRVFTAQQATDAGVPPEYDGDRQSPVWKL